ncbi:MAG: RagB/SusD family nutrient uptake outer membrane protein, partial [Bacteroidales bacterium]|nr:RagB/SusD family nutrient uptake outer membrane protein [Bacteroidales bacterium]
LRKFGNISSNPSMAALYGEALVARALLYAELLKAYGEVPARFEPISPETIYINKSDKDVIFKQLLSDLEEAAPLLPWPAKSTQTSVTTRPSRAFALGLYARFALVASGWSLRPDDGKVGSGNAGSVRKSVDPMFAEPTDLYTKALTGLEDVIEHSGLSLYEDYTKLWKDFNNFDIQAGKEVIYSLPMSDSRGRWNYNYAIRAEGGSVHFTTDAAKTKGGAVGPIPTMFWRYGVHDQRRDVSCANFETHPAGTVDRQVIAGGQKWYFGKYRFDWMTKVPYVGGNDDGCKPVYMRYSDILLMAAELANELGDMPKAKGYLKEVRDRAYKGYESEVTTYLAGLTTKEDVFNAIVDERALEFIGEFLRKGDLIRWNLLESKIAESQTEMRALSERSGAFSDIAANVYVKYAADGATITDYWGYEHGQTAAPSGEGWVAYTDSQGAVPSNYFEMSEPKINSFYFSAYTPNQRQWWPIPAVTLTNAQGSLLNDYGF